MMTNDRDRNGENIRISIPVMGIIRTLLSDWRAWAGITAICWGLGDTYTKLLAVEAAKEAKQTAAKVQETAESTKRDVTEVKEIAEEQQPKTDAIRHELSNGLAQRIGNYLFAKIDPRLSAVEKELKELRRDLYGDGTGAEKSKTLDRTAVRP